MQRRRSGKFLCLALAFVGGLSAAEAANWPRYRGPNGAGASADKEVPVQWTEKNFLWKTKLPGLGNSSPIVWEDKVFLQASSEDGDKRFMVCLGTADGKILWSAPLPAGKGKTHPKNTLASSTPATDGERVYGYFWDGKEVSLAAFDFKGTALWQRQLGEFKSQHGPGTSPIVWEDKVIVNNDTDDDAKVLAFDAKTGEPAWTILRTKYRASYATPLLLEKTDGPAELIVGSSAGVASYNPKTGAENWTWNWSWDKQALRMVSSPIFAQGMILVNAGEGPTAANSQALAIKAEGKGDVTKTNLAWEKKKSVPYVPTMLASGDYLYYVHDTGKAGCLAIKTGKEEWKDANLPNFDHVTASPILVDGKIYAVAEDGKVVVFEASPKGLKVLAKNKIPEPVMATPAVADNRMYIRGSTTLYCIGKAK
jgi:outer membrane protein assembly factor BamB